MQKFKKTTAFRTRDSGIIRNEPEAKGRAGKAFHYTSLLIEGIIIVLDGLLGTLFEAPFNEENSMHLNQLFRKHTNWKFYHLRKNFERSYYQRIERFK